MDYLWSDNGSFDTPTPMSEFTTDYHMEVDPIPASNRSFDRPIIENPLVSNGSYNYGSIGVCYNGEGLNESINKKSDPIRRGRELSTEETMRVAAARFIHLSAQTDGDPFLLVSPLALTFPGLMPEDTNNVDLASLLFSAAEKVSNQQYDRARNLLELCSKLSPSSGNPVQRVVYYFSETLKERIHRETGRLSFKRERESFPEDVIRESLPTHPMKLVVQQKLPFSQLLQFTSMQTIIDNVASARRIHMIDLSISHGMHWTILMQALATRHIPIDYLKISAVGASKETVTTTCKRLVSFAESLRLPFFFKVVIVSNVGDLKEEMFEVQEEEAVGVYSSTNMNTLIMRPDTLENLMKVLRRLKPCVMTVMDVEGKHNSPFFINRFTEALFYYSAFFDCIDSFMDRNDTNRTVLEGNLLLSGIKSIIASEGREREVRHVGVSVWRTFFARFGVVEVELNEWSPYLASLLVNQFAHGSSCTLDKNGKSLTIGWKGTPLFFISAWKFPTH